MYKFYYDSKITFISILGQQHTTLPNHSKYLYIINFVRVYIIFVFHCFYENNITS